MLKFFGKCVLTCFAWFVAKSYSLVDRVDDYMNEMVDHFLGDS